MKSLNITEQELNGYTLDKQSDYLFGYAVSKNTDGKWKYSNCPVAKDSKPTFKKRWNDAVKKRHDEADKPITAWYILQYWIADEIARGKARDNKQFVSEAVGAAYWLKEERWNNGVIKVEGSRERNSTDSKKCKCGQEVHGPQYSECIDCIGKDENGRLTGWAVEQMRDFHKRYPGLKHRNREQSIAFLKQRMKSMGRYKKPVVVRIINKLNNPHKYNHVYKEIKT